jgi:tetratricopeptide (TPR) repeat protein
VRAGRHGVSTMEFSAHNARASSDSRKSTNLYQRDMTARRNSIRRKAPPKAGLLPLAVIFSTLGLLPLAVQGHVQSGSTATASEAGHSQQEALLLDAVHRKEWDKAAKLGAELVRESPHNSTYWYWLGVARSSLQDPLGGIQALRSAELLGLNTADLHMDLGLGYYTIYQFFLFQQQMEKAIALDPKDFRPRYYLGRYRESVQDDYTGAMKFFDEAVKLNPEDAKSWTHRGLCLKELGQRAEAQAALETAIKLEERKAERFSLPYQGMAQLVLEEDPNQALPFARKAVEMEPNLESNHLTMAKIYERMGKLSEAEAELRTSIQLDPTDASARLVCFRVCNRLGEYQAAEDELKEFKEVNRLYGAQ